MVARHDSPRMWHIGEHPCATRSSNARRRRTCPCGCVSCGGCGANAVGARDVHVRRVGRRVARLGNCGRLTNGVRRPTEHAATTTDPSRVDMDHSGGCGQGVQRGARGRQRKSNLNSQGVCQGRYVGCRTRQHIRRHKHKRQRDVVGESCVVVRRLVICNALGDT